MLRRKYPRHIQLRSPWVLIMNLKVPTPKEGDLILTQGPYFNTSNRNHSCESESVKYSRLGRVSRSWMH